MVKSLFYNLISCKIKIQAHICCPGQGVKRYPRAVGLGNQKLLRAPGPRTKHFEPFFVVKKTNNIEVYPE